MQKTEGCNHVRCPQCGHDFCWVCIKTWKNHGGGHFHCNRYDPLSVRKRYEMSTHLHKSKEFHHSNMAVRQLR